jgi:hypothetical protein
MGCVFWRTDVSTSGASSGGPVDSKAAEGVADVSAPVLSTHMEDVEGLVWGLGCGLESGVKRSRLDDGVGE